MERRYNIYAHGDLAIKTFNNLMTSKYRPITKVKNNNSKVL